MITIKPFQAIAFGENHPASEIEEAKHTLSSILAQAEYSVSTEQLNVSDVYLGERSNDQADRQESGDDSRIIVAYFRPRSEGSKEAEFSRFAHVLQQMNGAADFMQTGDVTLQGEINAIPVEISMYTTQS